MKLLLFAACCICTVVGLSVGYSLAHIYSPMAYSTLQEFQVHSTKLSESNLQPQTREYLKSRIYYLTCHIDAHNLKHYKLDYGPVDEAILAGLSGVKGGDSPSDAYACALEKLKQVKAEQAK